MTPVIEACQILGCDEGHLFHRAYAWYYGATHNVESAAKNQHAQYARTKTYPHFVLAFSQAVRRNGVA